MIIGLMVLKFQHLIFNSIIFIPNIAFKNLNFNGSFEMLYNIVKYGPYYRQYE